MSAPREEVEGAIRSAFANAGLDPELGVAIGKQESGLNADAEAQTGGDLARGGAYGPMQVTLATARGLGFAGKPTELKDPKVNAELAAKLVAQLSSRFPDQRDVIAAYNSGQPYGSAPDVTRNKYVPGVLAHLTSPDLGPAEPAVPANLGPVESESGAQRAANRGQTLSPEAAARGIENAPELGVDPAFAANDDMLAAVATRKMARTLVQAPALQEFANRSDAHAAAIKDSYEQLTPLEWWITGRWEMGGEGEETVYDPSSGIQLSGPRAGLAMAPAPFRAFEQGVAGLLQAYHTGKQFLGLGTPADEWQASFLERAQQEDLAPRGLLGEMVTGAARAAPGVGAIVGASLIGGAPAMVGTMFAQGVGPLFRRLKQENPTMTDEDARQWAFSGAGLSAAMQLIPALGFLGKTPVVQRIVAKIGQDSIARAIASRATELTGHALSGAVMVATQSAVEQATSELASGEPDWSAVGEATQHGFVQGLKDMTLLGAAKPVLALLEDLGRLRTARMDRAKLDLIERAADSAPIVGKEPGVAAQVIDNAASQPGASSTVYVDHAAIVKDEDLGQQVASVAGQPAVDEAALTRGDIPVKMADYLAGLVGEREKLKDDVKLKDDGWTPRQADEWKPDEGLAALTEEQRARIEPLITPPEEPTVTTLPPAAVLRQYAEGLIAGKPISDISPGRYRQQERRAMDAAVKAGLAHDEAGAREQQNAATVARHMADAAETAQKRAAEAQGYLESRATDEARSVFNKAPPEYGAVADGLLQATGFLPNERPIPGAMDALVQRMKADGVEPAFSVDGVRRLLERQPPFDQLKVSEAQEVARALRSLRYVGHRTQEVALGNERVTVQNLVERVVTEAQGLPDHALTPADLAAVRGIQQARNYLEAFQAVARAPERLLAKLGPSGQALFDRYIAARNYRDRLSADVTAYYEKHWDESMPEDLKRSRYDVLDLSGLQMPAGMDPTRTRTWLWKVMLHMGTETNRARLLQGYGWTADDVLTAAGKYLSAPELRFIQSIWDYNDKTLWPLVRAQEERLNGFAPAKEQAVPFAVRLADGSTVEMRGGYFPLREDARPGVQPDPSPRSGPGRYLDTEYRVPSTAHSWTQERIEGARYLVNLQWNDVPGHVSQVVHDLAMRETVLDLAKVIDDPTFQRIAVQKLGAEGYQQLPAWLAVAANGRAEYAAQHMNKLTEAVGAVRSRVATAAVVGSIPVLLGQFSHPLVAMAGGEISVKNGGDAWLRGFSPDVREAARKVFPELLHRYETNQQNFRQMLGNIGPRGDVGPVGTAAEKVRLVAHGMQQIADDVVSTQLALGAHADALDKGLTGQAAVDYADRIVRKLMPTHDIAEQSALLRDRGVIGSLLMFHGFLNKIYNVTADKALSAQMAYRQGDWATVAVRTGQVLGMLAALGVGRYIMGRGPHEDETTGEYAAKEAMLMPSELIPFGRDIMQPFVDSLLTDKSVSQAFRDSADINIPAFGFYRNAMVNIGKLADSEQPNEDRIVAAVDLALAGLKVPRQPLRTGKYLYDVAAGNEQPRGPFDFASGVIYGGRQQQNNPQSTLPSDLQTALR